MKRMKSLVLALAVVAALSVSAAGFTPKHKSVVQGADCCDMKGCCKDADMSCCKKKDKNGKNAHACCKGKDNAASCCCKGDCPMPNKKSAGGN